MSGEFFESGLKKFGSSPSSLPFRLFVGLRNIILKQADAFSAISSEIASEWVANRVPGHKIHLIPNGVDTTHFVPVDANQKSLLRKKLNLPQNATIAIYTGRLVSYKGLPLLLRVWAEIRCKHENVLLLLAGTGGLDIHNCEAQLHDYVRSAGLDSSVRFLGPVRNIPEYLQAADLFVFPTENDAFPSSLVEAMACGLPVVATPVGAIKTIIEHQNTGLVVQPRDHDQLYDAIEALVVDRALARRVGRAGRQAVEERYSAGSMLKKYLSLFESTLQARQKGIETFHEKAS
jgi:glycosyltransferase involved in cell wall biosynthesis